MNSKYCGSRLPSLRVFMLRLGLALACVLGASVASAVSVSLVINSTFDTPQVYFEDSFVYASVVEVSPGRVTVTGGLYKLRQVAPGKFAVVLLGFKDDVVLLDSLLVDVITHPDPSDPALEVIFQLFKLEFYSDPQGLGFDPVALLEGYAATYFSKTLANTCPFRENYCWVVPDGYFGLKAELGGGDVHGLMVAVKTGLLPEPGSALLLMSGLLGLCITSRRQLGGLVKLNNNYRPRSPKSS
jgi:hypothetical protein